MRRMGPFSGAGVFTAIVLALITSSNPPNAAPVALPLLTPPLLHKIEAGEAVRGWYWQGGPTVFDQERVVRPAHSSRRPHTAKRRTSKGTLRIRPASARIKASKIRLASPAIKNQLRLTCEEASQAVAGYAFSHV